MKKSQTLQKALSLLTTALLIFAYVTPVLATTNADGTQVESDSIILDELAVETSEEVIPIEPVELEDPIPSSVPDIVEESEPPIVDSSSQTEINTTEESLETTAESTETVESTTTETTTTEESGNSSEPSTSTSESPNTSTSSSTEESSSSTTDTSQTSSSSTSDLSTESSEVESSSSEDSSTSLSEQTTDSEADDSESSSESSQTLEGSGSQSSNEESQKEPSKETQSQHLGHTLPQGSFPSVGTVLDAQLASQNFIESNLNGFELPMLKSYQNKQDAAIVYAALSHLNKPYDVAGKGPESFNNLNFPRYLYHELFSVELSESFDELIQFGAKTEVNKVRPGDLLVWEKEQKVAIYLGQNKFIMADDTLSKEQARNKEPLPEIKTEDQEAIPGVRIFTLHLDALEEELPEEQDLLTRYDFIRTPDFSVNRPSNWELNRYGQKQLDLYPVTFDFQENPQTTAFIESIGEYARDLGLKYDVFASVLIAQGILESGSGSSGLSRAPYYNVFGIKGSSGGASVQLPTMEDNGKGELYGINAAFRVYPSYEKSLEDYVSLIRSGISGNKNFYRQAWRSEAQNYLKATRELTGKYATDTHYNNKLNSIIAAYNLTRFDKPRATLSNEMMSFHQIPAVYREKIRFPEYNGQNYNTSGSYGSDQCTWYVFNRVKQLGGSVGDFMGNGADWRDTGDREGYVTSGVPRVGYVVSFKQGVAGYHPLYGHVAFVEAVSDDGILISEGDASYINYRVIPNEIALSSGVGYVAPK